MNHTSSVDRLRGASSTTTTGRKPSPLRKSFRLTEDGIVEEDYGHGKEEDTEQSFHLAHKYRELYIRLNTEIISNIALFNKYQHREKLLSWIPSLVLLVPLIAGILAAISSVYKQPALILASSITTVGSTTLIAVVNAVKVNLNYTKTATWYHDRASKLKEVQDHLSMAINLRQYDIDEFTEHSSRTDLLLQLPEGSDITGTQNLISLPDNISERPSRVGTPNSSHSIPHSLQRKLGHVLREQKASSGSSSPVTTPIQPVASTFARGDIVAHLESRARQHK